MKRKGRWRGRGRFTCRSEEYRWGLKKNVPSISGYLS